MLYIDHRGVAQSGSASALGAEGRRFESSRPDQNLKGNPMRKALDRANKKKQLAMLKRGRVGMKNRKQKRIPQSAN